MSFRSSQVAECVGGVLFGKDLNLEGISSTTKPREKTVIFCTSLREYDKVKDVENSTLVISQRIDHKSYILVEDVKLSLARFLDFFFKEEHPVGVSPKAHVEEGTVIGKDVYVGPFAYVGKKVVLEDKVKVYPFCYVGDYTHIGEESVLFSGVKVYPRCVIGKRVRIHSGAVIGADGFGYHITKEGIFKLNHIGNVIIEDDVEIGANTTIDRAMIDSTRIGKQTKIDNLVMIAHNCEVGERNLIVSQVGLSGSVKTGKNVVLAGQVGVADHVNIGDSVQVAAKSGVAKDLEPNKVYGANLPAIEWSKWKRIYVYLLKLPELFKR
ncbi:UDP-3-O-(3-hydroxymyristoyl)glucosamine N-acyltransferase [Thermocrinis sp.]